MDASIEKIVEMAHADDVQIMDDDAQINGRASAIAASIERPVRVGNGRGIVICAGGLRYFTNAWILIHLLRRHGCILPIEFWAFDAREFDLQMRTFAKSLGVIVRFADAALERCAKKTVPGRWQWALKPYAILASSFEEVLLLDADNFPVRDPSDLFESDPYRVEGSLFWPDLQVTEPSRRIWGMLGISFRVEPEFETGQMLVNKHRCWEPLLFSLWMNLRADIFYTEIWGDKDTFRFAWHKFGRSFAMVPFPVQTLGFPGNPDSVAVMCQHDLDGNWLFQHRNMAKWSLLGDNPRIAGFMFDAECRQYLALLRRRWNGEIKVSQIDHKRSRRASRRLARLRKALLQGVWLFEDRKPKQVRCCSSEIECSDERQSLPWTDQMPSLANSIEPAATIPSRLELRYREMTFLADSIGCGADDDLCWWTLEEASNGMSLTLQLRGQDGVSVSLRPMDEGGWTGHWVTKPPGRRRVPCRLLRPDQVYPENATIRLPSVRRSTSSSVHIVNSAFGIGDAITGIYAITGLVQAGYCVTYHTRHSQWLSRINVSGLTITGDEPPFGTADLHADYAEQLRFGRSKPKWYAMMAAAAFSRRKKVGIEAPAFKPVRPPVCLWLGRAVLEFRKYVMLVPFAAKGERDWPKSHWNRLAHLLVQTGYEVVAVGLAQDEGRMRDTFERSYSYWIIDQSPDWVMSAMLRAQCVIGLDSGMIHVAGMLGAPAICIHAQLPPKFLFSHAPSVFSVCPQTQCVFCRWQEDKGYNEGCASACSALATVSPEQVMAKLMDPKLAELRRKMDKRIERDTRRFPYSPVSPVPIEVAQPDIIAYRLPPESGMGEAAQMNIAAFRAAGLVVEERLWDRIGMAQEVDGAAGPIYYHHWHPQPDEAHRHWQSAGFRTGSGTTHIGYWAYEVEGEVPPAFQMLAPFMTELWTPSTFCKRVFERTGRPVHVVHHSVPFLEKLHDLPAKDGKAPYTVLYLFDAWSRFARKNPLAAIRVFQQTFRFRHDVRLVLKGHHLGEAELAELMRAGGHDSRITVINQFLSPAELDGVFDRSDALLSLQRGEGFGLNIARALGRGLPVITTGWGGQLDFCTADNAILVPYRLKSVTEEKEHSFAAGLWAEPDGAAAARLLARLEAMSVSDAPTLLNRRENGRRLIATEFSQTALNERIFNRLNALRATSHAT